MFSEFCLTSVFFVAIHCSLRLDLGPAFSFVVLEYAVSLLYMNPGSFFIFADVLLELHKEKEGREDSVVLLFVLVCIESPLFLYVM